jgi:serine/threonine-protein kinase
MRVARTKDMSYAATATAGEGQHPLVPRAGDYVDERYQVLQVLGRGGMCIVLHARDEKLGRDVALKLVLPRLTSRKEIVARFENEARSLARLDSPHVVKVLDFGNIQSPAKSAGLPYMVLELLKGKDLFAYVAEYGKLAPEQVVRFALEACDGLAAAHAEGIIHRDLKPENLFVAVEPDASECLKVLDFGIARAGGGPALTLDNCGVGSPGYMSPEQVARSSQVDVRSDIWSLGVVMYELLASRPVFTGSDPHELCSQILAAPIASLAELRPDLPPALIYVVERCLERDPERRFQDVAQLAEALAPLDECRPPDEAKRIRRRLEMGSEPVLPLRHPVRYETPTTGATRVNMKVRARKSPRRRAAGAAVVMLLLAPVFWLLSPVAKSPELAPARAWSARLMSSTQVGLTQLRDAAKDWIGGASAGKPADAPLR